MAAGAAMSSFSAISEGPSQVNLPPWPDFGGGRPMPMPSAGWRSWRWIPLLMSFFSTYFRVSALCVLTSLFSTLFLPSSSRLTALIVTFSCLSSIGFILEFYLSSFFCFFSDVLQCLKCFYIIALETFGHWKVLEVQEDIFQLWSTRGSARTLCHVLLHPRVNTCQFCKLLLKRRIS